MYLDTAIVVKLMVREPDSLFYAQLVQGQLVWTAEIALSECHSALLRKEREAAVTARQQKAACKQLELDVAERRLALVSVTRSLLERANAILDACHPDIALRSLDAIHLAAAAQCASWPLCTNDARMRAAALKMGYPLSPLPGHKDLTPG
jgi:predicted nucleic acid-binding protein